VDFERLALIINGIFMQKVSAFFKKLFFFSGIVLAFLVFALFGFILVLGHFKGGSNSDVVVLLKNTFSDEYNSLNTLAFYDSIDGNTWVYHVPVEVDIVSSLSDQSASQLFGLLISKSVTLPLPKEANQSKEFTKNELQQNLRFSFLNTSPFQSDFWDYWWWWWHIRSRSSSQLKIRSFDSLESWNAYAPERDFQVSTQPCSIAVVNTTGVTGLATEVGEILERSGLFVARLTNNQSNTTNSLILTKNLEECQEVIDALGVLTPNSTEVAIDEAAATRYRARVVLLVGKDLIPADETEEVEDVDETE
jgi:hypothetical protein